jgi:hypothetical protein
MGELAGDDKHRNNKRENLRNQKGLSSETDGITPRLLKGMDDSILTPLEFIFQKPLSTGKVPKEWKQAKNSKYRKGSKRKKLATAHRYLAQASRFTD